MQYVIRQIDIELTTKCNFDCDYCYTKHLPDAFITRDQFTAIVDEWANHTYPLTFNLTGEGESLLHPQFWEFVDYIKATTNHRVTFITNGSALNEANRQLIASKLDAISVTIDTMDVGLAERIGRHNMDRVINNVRELAQIYNHITIMTVNYGQDLGPVIEFASTLPAENHRIKPLVHKDDYRYTYTKIQYRQRHYPHPAYYKCTGIQAGTIAYKLTGLKMPCCFIKDVSKYPGYDELLAILLQPDNQTLPSCCAGCDFMCATRPRA